MVNFAATYKEGPIAIRYPRGSAFHSEEVVTDFILVKLK